MPKSYRIRTNVGVDKSVNISIDQEFEYIEILSLKVLQSDIYTRVCSDYGVVIGRVSVNDGFGIPNAKVSIFIPLTNEDAEDPIISQIYPYKTVLDVNDDGYRYNLLPYEPSYSAHQPTGTFPSKIDVLTNPTLIEVYDKYYKLNAVTNQSGDFMIFGVPVGSQTLVVDIDLSDIGEFSLSPQDLIRMGIASESQVSGTNFKTSSNLRELPQIVNFTRTIVVEPLWGQSEVCNLGITRTDFDLSDESNINIEPTAIFMGSLISTNDDQHQKKNCKPKNKSGELCSLTTGPGEILAIRQTIFLDINGRPGLETFDLEQAGQVIDENGVWLIDVPMNLDFLITNEFGDQIISDDPNKGIPTRGKYRFKVKWNQSPTLNEPIRRGYYLVPNIKEHGWVTSARGDDPLTLDSNDPNYIKAVQSYSFSLDWNDYPDIQGAIDCEDTFYMMSYNKVYTVSQLITQYRKGYSPNKIVSIKNIISDDCSSDINKFPTNDAVYRFDLIFFLLKILSYVFKPTLIGLVILAHVLYFLVVMVGIVLTIIIVVIGGILILICSIVAGIMDAINDAPSPVPNVGDPPDCPDFQDLIDLIEKIIGLADFFRNIKIPNLSYPDCDVCSCSEADQVKVDNDEEMQQAITTIQDNGGYGVGTNFFLDSSYLITGDTVFNTKNKYSYQQLFVGSEWTAGGQYDAQNVLARAPQLVTITNPDDGADKVTDTFTSSIPIGERLNLFNTKAKYFNGPQDMPSVLLNGECKISNLATPTPAAGNIITIENISNPWLFIGAVISGPGIDANTTILSYLGGTGGAGTYTVSGPPQLVSSGTNFTVPNFAVDSPGSTPNSDNPGGGVNRIKVKVAPEIPTNSSKFHLDNVVALVIKDGLLSRFESGKVVTFQDPLMSSDSNMSGATLNYKSAQSIVGDTITPLISGKCKANNAPDIPVDSGNTLTVTTVTYNGLIPGTVIRIQGDVDGNGDQIDRTIILQLPLNPSANDVLNGTGRYTISGGLLLINNPVKFVVVTSTTRTLTYADPSGNGTNISVTYDLVLTGDTIYPQYDYQKFPMDLEYYQVITGMTYSDYLLLTNPIPNTSVTSWDNLTFNRRFLNNNTMIYNVSGVDINWYVYNQFGGTANYPAKTAYTFNNVFEDINKQGIVFLVRGVDPHSTRVNIEYDLSKLFGFYNFGDGPKVSGKFKLNHPIKGGFKTVNHDNINFNVTIDGYSNLPLYYDSFHMTLIPNGVTATVPDPVQPELPPFRPPIVIGSGFSSFTSNMISYYSSFDNSTITNNFNPGTSCSYAFPTSVGGYGPSVPPVPSITNGAQANAKGARLKISDFQPIPSTSPIDLSELENNRTIGNNGFIVEWKLYTIFLPPTTPPFIICPPFPPYSFGSRYNTESNSFGTNTTKNRGYFETEIVEGSGFMYQNIDMGQSFVRVNSAGNIFCDNYPPPNRYANGYYYAPGYDQTNTTIQFISRLKTVMRSDKLPTSTALQPNYCNSFPLQNNNNFSAFILSDNGVVKGVGDSDGFSSNTNLADVDDGTKKINSVLESFECAQMAPLPCYRVRVNPMDPNTGLESTDFYVEDRSNDCWESGPLSNQKGFENGCYVFVSKPLITLFNGHDLLAILEWSERLLITFGACRDVFSHLFTNNWVNGTLYAWSFNNNVTFSPPTDGNRPSSQFCKDTLMLHPTTNNFYYRSSPFSNSGGFVGADRPDGKGLFGISYGEFNGNFKNLLYPTTIVDLGPRNNYMQEIVMSDEFDGYVVSKLVPTTYQDVSDLLMLFIISRLGNLSTLDIIASGFGFGPQIETFFNRNESGVLGISGTKMIDADYAQMVAINSELGVVPFDKINYQDYDVPENPPGIQDPVFIAGDNIKDVVIGVFFRADLQLRDYISPKRTIIDGLAPINTQVTENCVVKNINCNVNNFPVKSQIVPFYDWNIRTGGPNNTIFGSQQNDWYSDAISNNGFMAHRYQDLKREDPDSRYFRTEPNTLGLNYYPGFISAVQASGTYINPITNDYWRNSDGYYNYSARDSNWDKNDPTPRTIHTGAPFYFYFGLKKGQTAYDRFSRKWIPTQTILTYE